MQSPRPRSQDIAIITEHFESFFAHPDLVVFRRLFDKLGWSAFTDEAIAELADAYVWRAADRERRNAENRALAARQSSERSDQSEQEAA